MRSWFEWFQQILLHAEALLGNNSRAGRIQGNTICPINTLLLTLSSCMYLQLFDGSSWLDREGLETSRTHEVDCSALGCCFFLFCLGLWMSRCRLHGERSGSASPSCCDRRRECKRCQLIYSPGLGSDPLQHWTSWELAPQRFGILDHDTVICDLQTHKRVMMMWLWHK